MALPNSQQSPMSAVLQALFVQGQFCSYVKLFAFYPYYLTKLKNIKMKVLMLVRSMDLKTNKIEHFA